MAMARAARVLDRFTFGGRTPGSVGLLLALTLAASLLAAFTSRHAEPSLFSLAALEPSLVFRGQVWRLVTWAFVEPSPLWLIFGCLFLWWFGRDLADAWGSLRFLLVWFGVTLFASVVTCLVGLVDFTVLHQPYLGGFAISEALIVAWGLWFPDRIVRLYFIIPIRSYWLAWLTIAITAIYAIYSGWERFVPVLVADAAMVAWLFRRSFTRKWASLQRARRANTVEANKRAVAKKRRASASHLRVIEGGDHDPPPLPPELEGKIGRLLGDAGKRPKDD